MIDLRFVERLDEYNTKRRILQSRRIDKDDTGKTVSIGDWIDVRLEIEETGEVIEE